MNDKRKNEMHQKNEDTNKGIGQKIKCNVTECTHNCIEDSTCRLECIKVGVMSDKVKANNEDETCCNSYNFGGDLNKTEITGRD